MTSRPNPTVKGARLALALRKLREHSSLSQSEVAQHVGCSVARVSRVENADLRVSPAELGKWLDLYGVTDQTERDALTAFAKEAGQAGWWKRYDDVLPKWFSSFVAFEAEAVSLKAFNLAVVHGLFQTPEYARSLLKLEPTARFLEPDELDRMVEVRMERQQILDQPHRPEVGVILNEAALRLHLEPAGVMRKQLEHLIEAADRPNVTLQILLPNAPAAGRVQTPFTILNLGEGFPTYVYLEHLTGSLFLDQRNEVRQYRMVLDHLTADALGTAESVRHIRQVIKDL